MLVSGERGRYQAENVFFRHGVPDASTFEFRQNLKIRRIPANSGKYSSVCTTLNYFLLLLLLVFTFTLLVLIYLFFPYFLFRLRLKIWANLGNILILATSRQNLATF